MLLISTVWGWRLGLLAAVASALAFNWFHIPPTGRFDVAADRDAVALVVFVIVAVASSSLAEMARARAAEAERRRQETERGAGRAARSSRPSATGCRRRRSRPGRCAAATS